MANILIVEDEKNMQSIPAMWKAMMNLENLRRA